MKGLYTFLKVYALEQGIIQVAAGAVAKAEFRDQNGQFRKIAVDQGNCLAGFIQYKILIQSQMRVKAMANASIDINAEKMELSLHGTKQGKFLLQGRKLQIGIKTSASDVAFGDESMYDGSNLFIIIRILPKRKLHRIFCVLNLIIVNFKVPLADNILSIAVAAAPDKIREYGKQHVIVSENILFRGQVMGFCKMAVDFFSFESKLQKRD